MPDGRGMPDRPGDARPPLGAAPGTRHRRLTAAPTAYAIGTVTYRRRRRRQPARRARGGRCPGHSRRTAAVTKWRTDHHDDTGRPTYCNDTDKTAIRARILGDCPD